MVGETTRDVLVEVKARVEEHEKRIKAHKVELLASVGKIEADLKDLIKDRTDLLMSEIKKINITLEKNYVPQIQFKPVKTVVYGMIGFVLMSVAGALAATLIK